MVDKSASNCVRMLQEVGDINIDLDVAKVAPHWICEKCGGGGGGPLHFSQTQGGYLGLWASIIGIPQNHLP